MDLATTNSGMRVAGTWVLAGLALIALAGLSFSIETPRGPMAAEAAAPVRTVAPEGDQMSAAELEDAYTELLTPVTLEEDEVRTGVAP